MRLTVSLPHNLEIIMHTRPKALATVMVIHGNRSRVAITSINPSVSITYGASYNADNT